MASISKYRKQAVGNLFLHNNRMQGDGITHSNESIDDSRTSLNYYLKHGSVEDLNERLQEVFSYNKKNVTVLCEAVVTLPKNVPAEDEEKFFRSVYNFFAEDFGEKNIINAVIHKDENTPHMHLDFVPAISGERKEQYTCRAYQESLEQWKKIHGNDVERLCASELINIGYMNSFHSRLSEYVGQDLQYETEIINGATENGNLTVKQLKLKTLQDKIEQLRQVHDYLGDEIAKMYQLGQAHGISREDMKYLPLLEKIDMLYEKIKVFESIMMRENISYRGEDLRRLKGSPVMSSPVSVIDGSYADYISPEENCLYVIELAEPDEKVPPTQRTRSMVENSVQKAFINTSAGADARMTFTRSGLEKKDDYSTIADGRKDAVYLYIKQADEQRVYDVLHEVTERIRAYVKKKQEAGGKVKRIYMDRLTYDKYNIGLNMIEQLGVPVSYHSGIQQQEAEEESTREQNLEKN